MTQLYRLIQILLIFLLLPLAAPSHAKGQAKIIASIDNLHELDSIAKLGDFTIITVSAGNHDYNLKLELSNVIKNLNTSPRSEFQDVQLLKGTVIGDEKSWVRLSRYDNRVSGYIKAFGSLIELTNSHNNQFALKSINPKDPILRNFGLDRVLTVPESTNIRPKVNFTNNISHREREEDQKVSRVLQISIVIDSRFNEFYKGQGLSKAISVINEVDGLYQEQFGLGVQLRSAILLDPNNDPFLELDGNLETVLREFRLYTQENKSFSDGLGLLHLFSGAYDNDQIIGLSWIDTVCHSENYNVSVSTPFSAQMILAAHEMGHNLGAKHDDSKSCEIEYDKVMWPSISRRTEQEFSSCSKNAVSRALSASCNLDNIDLSVVLELNSKPEESESRRVSIIVNNNDAFRIANNVSTITHLSTELVPKKIPTGCSYFSNTLTCEHGAVTAGAKKAIVIDLDATQTKDQIISTELEFSDFADLNSLNNRANIDLKTAIQSDEQSDETDNAALSSGGSGGGALNLALVFALYFSKRYKIRTKTIIYKSVSKLC